MPLQLKPNTISFYRGPYVSGSVAAYQMSSVQEIIRKRESRIPRKHFKVRKEIIQKLNSLYPQLPHLAIHTLLDRVYDDILDIRRMKIWLRTNRRHGGNESVRAHQMRVKEKEELLKRYLREPGVLLREMRDEVERDLVLHSLLRRLVVLLNRIADSS